MIINGDLRIQTKEMDAGAELIPAMRTPTVKTPAQCHAKSFLQK